MFLHKVYF